MADMESGASKPNVDVDFIAAGWKPSSWLRPESRTSPALLVQVLPKTAEKTNRTAGQRQTHFGNPCRESNPATMMSILPEHLPTVLDGAGHHRPEQQIALPGQSPIECSLMFLQELCSPPELIFEYVEATQDSFDVGYGRESIWRVTVVASQVKINVDHGALTTNLRRIQPRLISLHANPITQVFLKPRPVNQERTRQHVIVEHLIEIVIAKVVMNFLIEAM